MSYDRNQLVSDVIAFEQGELDEERTVALFQHLVDTGDAWRLQGSYGRAVMDMVHAGLIELKSCPSEDPDHPGLQCAAVLNHDGDHLAQGHRWRRETYSHCQHCNHDAPFGGSETLTADGDGHTVPCHACALAAEVAAEPFTGDPFAGIPNAHDEENQPL